MSRPGLHALVAANAPLWAAEAEVVRSYWNSPARSRASDCKWLLHQCYKEYWDGFIPPLRRLNAQLDAIDRGIGRADILTDINTLAEEFAHYVAFADVYETLRTEAEPPVDPALLKQVGDWPENVTLVTLRAEHKRLHGELGQRAHAFTEGGYCTLYSEGMRLRGRGGIDDLIATACGLVYDDEFGHMLLGIAGLDQEALSARDWELLRELTVAQMRLRIEMRNAQFGFPVVPQRIAELQAGRCAPLDFDWDRAGLLAPAA